VPATEEIAPPEGRLERLRGRLARSQNALGRSLLGLIGGGDLDEDSWEQIEDTLLIADLGPTVTSSIVAQLRSRLASKDVQTEADARAVLRDVLITELQPGLDRSVRALPHDDHPSVLLVVGVNGTGKTTTVGKLARVLVADGRMAAADSPIGRGDHHLHRRLPDVEAITFASAGLRLVGDHHRDGGRRVGDVPAASPHGRQVTQHLPIGHDDEVPRLVVLR